LWETASGFWRAFYLLFFKKRNADMETLPYCPKPNYTVSNEPKIKKMDFGDGYQQRRADGLNPLLRKFSVTFNLRNPQAVKLAQFLAKHKGVTAFLFKAENAKVTCPKWTENRGKTHTEIQCEFEEVVA
jgi:hypothetical protein